MQKSLLIIFALLLLCSRPAVGEERAVDDLGVEVLDLSEIPGLDGSYDSFDSKVNDDLMGLIQPILDGTFLEEQEDGIKQLGTTLEEDDLSVSLDDPTRPLISPTFGLGGYSTDIEAIMAKPGSGRKKTDAESSLTSGTEGYRPSELRGDRNENKNDLEERAKNNGLSDEDQSRVDAFIGSIRGLNEAAEKGASSSDDQFLKLLK